jgi:Uma2 family endonuclease
MNQLLPAPPFPQLAAGQHLTQAEFHRRYEEYPDDTVFELIAGVVYMASPQRMQHTHDEREIGSLLDHYRLQTPGVQIGSHATVILSADSEPQPDWMLWIDRPGRVNADDYFVGAPELTVEVSHASRAVDLGPKLAMYRAAGVREYLVIVGEPRGLRWFDFVNGGELTADAAGVWRSRVFPGLWINGPALLTGESRASLATLNAGLATPEYAAWVATLRLA